jgi:hypothetical protein
MLEAFLIALAAEGTIALDPVTGLAALVIDGGLHDLCRKRFEDQVARLTRPTLAERRLAGLRRGKPRQTRYGLQQDQPRQKHRQPSLALIKARTIHRLRANSLNTSITNQV